MYASTTCLTQIFEAIQPNYTTTDAMEAAWVGPLPGGPADEAKPRLLRTERGVITAPFARASLS
jgi:hypothetical protein